jgi:[acyl-carrier-protein] S-malonyltransferase
MSGQKFLAMFPGQGSQKPGMSKDLVERFPEAAAVWERADAALGFALSELAFNGTAEELTLTHNAQPALLTHGVAVWTILASRLAPHTLAVAGHSLGEFSAYVAADGLTLESAVRLVRRRGDLMLQVGQEVPGAMAAILGQFDRPIEEICARASGDGVVVPANYNSPEQIVISGDVEAVERAMAMAKESGAKRAVRLNVSGAFHSPLMAAARGELRRALDASGMKAPRIPVYSNVTADAVRTDEEAIAMLEMQLTSPVRWVRLMETMCSDYPGTPVLELGPGNVLCGLAKRIVPGVECMPIGTVADIDAFIAKYPA